MVGDPQMMAQLALTHTPVEHLLYKVMLAEVTAAQTRAGTFSSRCLMTLAHLPNYSAVRRGLQGLINKLSIEHFKVAGGDARSPHEAIYLVYTPEEIFARRSAAQFATTPSTARFIPENHSFAQAIERLAERYDLSRREAQVALCCAQGLTNAEIGERLFISEQTVKFHLRHIYLKYGVRRRAELISRLLAPDG
jgi:DNA-binding CsgD family transcriptional regulator